MNERIVLPTRDVSDDEQATIDGLFKQLADKTDRNLLRASIYDGKHAVKQLGTIIPPQYYRTAAVLGWAATACDNLGAHINLDGFVWTDGDLGSLGADEVWDGNYLDVEIGSGVLSSLIHGTSFLVNTLGDEDAGETRGLIHVRDAMNATGVWNPRTRRLDSLLSVTSRDDEGRPTSFALYLRNRTLSAEKDGGKWSVEVSDHEWGMPAEPLVYKPRVGRPFGSSRISRPVISLQEQALRTVIRMEGHADVFSFPQMLLMGADASMFKNADGSQKAAWQVALGRVLAVPDDEDATNPRADVKQFQAASPQPHIDHLKMTAGLFASETKLPITALGIQAETNTSTQDGGDRADDQMVAEAEVAARNFRPALRRAFVRALAMQNGLERVPDEWRGIDAKMRDPRHISQAAQADAGLKRLTMVPWLAETEVGLELLGLTEQQIQRALAEKRRAQGVTRLAEIVANVAPQADVDAG